jgi:hypothetical protein
VPPRQRRFLGTHFSKSAGVLEKRLNVVGVERFDVKQ